MLYGLSKIAVLGGHGDGENAIPAEFAATAALKAYREGTAMRVLAEAISAAAGIPNLRPEAADLSWAERAKRAKAAGAELAVELHTNWSVGSAGQPNSNIFLVIVPMYNPVHDTAAQKDMATRLFKPLSDAMGMTFQLRVRKGSGEWDYYSFLNFCNARNIPYPMIVEHGYHIDYASEEERFRRLIVNRYKEICELSAPGTLPETPPAPVEEVDETEPHSYMVHGGAFTNRENGLPALAKCKAAGYADAYMQSRDGVYFARCVLNDNLAYAMRNAEELAARGLEAGVVII